MQRLTAREFIERLGLLVLDLTENQAGIPGRGSVRVLFFIVYLIEDCFRQNGKAYLRCADDNSGSESRTQVSIIAHSFFICCLPLSTDFEYLRH